ncbi:MAG: PQQ-binding-like beta-propeller repeat protein [Planctomycetaceae bacterium]
MIRPNSSLSRWAVAILLGSAFAAQTHGSDWPRFRGPNGTGISTDSESLPDSIADPETLAWKTPLPGAGVSCPITAGDRIFVTCYSGYGVDRSTSGDMQQLKRHMVCVSAADGKVLWEKTIDSVLPEDEYSGMGVPEHGYASHTPVTDGRHVYGFFGKSGVYAWDLDGNQLWHTSVGTGSDDRAWGSSSSPILAGNVVVVAAGPESRAVVGLDAATGKELWKAESDFLGSVWGTPALSVVDDSRTDVVLGAPSEIWAINPQSGKLRWYCSAMQTDQFNSSVLVDGGMIYAVEGRGGGSIAIRGGGKGDVTADHVAWSGNDSNRFSTPLLYEGRLYLISGGTVKCIKAADGSEVFQGRLQSSRAGGGQAEAPREQRPSGGPGAPGAPGGPGGQGAPGQPPGGGRGGFGGFGGFGGGRGGRGGMGGQDYSSPVMGDGKIFYVSRSGDLHVLKPSETLEQISSARITTDTEDFSASPAISSGRLLIRSSKHLYCFTAKK